MRTKRTGPRLLIVNNMPAHYRTPLFEAIHSQWVDQTGGETLVAYQVRRDTHSRAEWFFTPDAELPFPHMFVSGDTTPAARRTGYPLRVSPSVFLRFRPTHLFVAGWDSPLAVQSAAWSACVGSRMAVWVESNPTTTRVSTSLSNRLRRRFLSAADLAVVPTGSSARYVDALAGREVPHLLLPNPVQVDRLEDSSRSTRRVIFLGDLSRRKGFDVFQRLAADLSAEGWASAAWGRDSEGLAGQSSHVSVNPPSRFADVVSHLDSADVLVIPSRSDPAPLTFSEGIALGLRIVLSDGVAYAGDARNTTGVSIARSEDVKSFVDAVHRASAMPRPPASEAERISPSHFALTLVPALLAT